MRGKLTLRLEDLSVDSFDTTLTHRARGTVFGEECTCQTQCTCPGCPSCDDTCPNTCGYTCDDYTCGGNSCDNTCQYTCYETDCDCSINATRCGGYICP